MLSHVISGGWYPLRVCCFLSVLLTLWLKLAEKPDFILYNIPLFSPTFENQPSSHQFGKLQTVQRENVVEDNGPEVGSIEHTTDPA